MNRKPLEPEHRYCDPPNCAAWRDAQTKFYVGHTLAEAVAWTEAWWPPLPDFYNVSTFIAGGD